MNQETRAAADEAQQTASQPRTADESPSESSPDWMSLLGYLQKTRGFDFHGYKPASLARRIRKRMDAVGVDNFARYQDYLEVHPDEFAGLFNTILINVTSFFRDPAAWDLVRQLAIPQILGAKAGGESIRVWSAGCASGEEAYTLAMVLSEELGEEQFRERVKIYATDVDEDALNTARQAVFTDRQIESVPPELLDKYFEQGDRLHTFRKELRRQVIFGRHDLISDAPISRIDLLTCRNTLMYLNAETQAKVLNRLHFALNNGGFLLLGRAETLMAHGHAFASVDLKRRLSRKTFQGTIRDRLVALQTNGRSEDEPEVDGRVTRAALEASPVAQLLVDSAGHIVLVNDRARSLFDLRGGEAGRPLRDLQISYRPVELHSLIERVETDHRPLVVKEIEWHVAAGETRWLDLSIAPLADPAGDILGALITWTDVTAHRGLQRELERSHQELETYEELQSTNEELETTNEELQSAVEELETTNEELQSTNEELETMNEELQSTNEELQTMNDELRRRGEDLNGANAFLESVLAGLKFGVAVVDRELRLLAWNAQAEELWGIRGEEARGSHLLNLDIGLPVERLRPMLKSSMAEDGAAQAFTLEAVNRRGKPIRCDVTCTPLRGADGDVHGAIVLMEESLDGQH